MTAKAIVFVIDDDEAVRKSLKRLLSSADYDSEAFKSAGDFLSAPADSGPSCLLVDVQMPGLNGLALQDSLIHRRQGRAARFYHRPRRHPDVRAGDESRRGRFSPQAV